MENTRKILQRVFIVILTTTLFGCASAHPPIGSIETDCDPGDPMAHTIFGDVCGVQTAGGFPNGSPYPVWAFRGIPYADTTKGAGHRWEAASDPIPWRDEPRPAKKAGPACAQLKTDPVKNTKSVLGSEDCLTVNVFTPIKPVPPGRQPASNPLPVMVFIHGGSYISGTGGSPLLDGANLAGGGQVVVVTLNYRLGVLGFLGGFGSHDTKNGNLGLKDQQKALQWVSNNIEYFGGDPNNVTLFGESAGASSVGVHLANDDSKALFERAIMESNHYGMRFQTSESAKSRAKALVKATQCQRLTEDEELKCLNDRADANLGDLLLKAVPSSESSGVAVFCNSFGGFEYWAPMIDHDFVKHQPIDTVIDKPVMLGTNRNEGVLFMALIHAYPRMLPFELDILITGLFGDYRGGKVLTAYHDFIQNNPDGVAAAKILTDYVFTCANNHVLDTASQNNPNLYGYRFTHLPSLSLYPVGWRNNHGIPEVFVGNFCFPDPKVDHSDNVCHGNELPFVFGNPVGFNRFGQLDPEQLEFTGQEKDLTSSMMHYWTGFAKNKVPSNSVPFPKFRPPDYPGAPYYLVLSDTAEGGIIQTRTLPEEAKCYSLWDDSPCKHHSDDQDEHQCIGWDLDWLQKVCTHWPW